MTNAEFYALAAPFVASYGLMLGIGMQSFVLRAPERLLSLSARRRGR
jgi:hypothetical protein